MGGKKKEFSFEFFNYKSKDSGLFGILLPRFFATAVKKLLRWFEIVRSSVIVSLSTSRLMLLKAVSFFKLIIDRIPSHTFSESFFIIVKKWFTLPFLSILARVIIRFLQFLNDSCRCFLLSALVVLHNCLQSLFIIFIELANAVVIQGFDFVLSFLLGRFLRGQCLSKKLSILLKKSWNDRRGSPEKIQIILFHSMFSVSFSKAFGSKLRIIFFLLPCVVERLLALLGLVGIK